MVKANLMPNMNWDLSAAEKYEIYRSARIIGNIMIYIISSCAIGFVTCKPPFQYYIFISSEFYLLFMFNSYSFNIPIYSNMPLNPFICLVKYSEIFI